MKTWRQFTLNGTANLSYLSGWRDEVCFSLLLSRRRGGSLRTLTFLTTLLFLPFATLFAPVH